MTSEMVDWMLQLLVFIEEKRQEAAPQQLERLDAFSRAKVKWMQEWLIESFPPMERLTNELLAYNRVLSELDESKEGSKRIFDGVIFDGTIFVTDSLGILAIDQFFKKSSRKSRCGAPLLAIRRVDLNAFLKIHPYPDNYLTDSYPQHSHCYFEGDADGLICLNVGTYSGPLSGSGYSERFTWDGKDLLGTGYCTTYIS